MVNDLDEYVEMVTMSTQHGSMGVLFQQPLPNLSAVLAGQHNGLVSSAQAEIYDQPRLKQHVQGCQNWLQIFGNN